MIHYSLKCTQDHRFDSWFQSAGAFDKLQSAGMVVCAVCGSDEVRKDIMAPRVNSGTASDVKDTGPSKETDAAPTPAARPLSQPASEAETALRALRDHVEKTSDYVGRDFAREARAIHDGDAPKRAIWGEARGDEARKLAEDGIPVAALPFLPTRKSN